MSAAKLAETAYHREQGVYDKLLWLTAVKKQKLEAERNDHSVILVKFHVRYANHDNQKDKIDAKQHKKTRSVEKKGKDRPGNFQEKGNNRQNNSYCPATRNSNGPPDQEVNT